MEDAPNASHDHLSIPDLKRTTFPQKQPTPSVSVTLSKVLKGIGFGLLGIAAIGLIATGVLAVAGIPLLAALTAVAVLPHAFIAAGIIVGGLTVAGVRIASFSNKEEQSKSALPLLRPDSSQRYADFKPTGYKSNVFK